MKPAFNIIIFLIIFTNSFAQEEKAHIEFGRNTHVSSIFLPDKNLFLITKPFMGAKPDLTIWGFSSTGDELWKKIIPTHFNTLKQKTMTISSPDGNFIYVIQQHDNGY